MQPPNEVNIYSRRLCLLLNKDGRNAADKQSMLVLVAHLAAQDLFRSYNRDV